ncbi:ABC-F family ATP-binding cassette domain-containing protein [Pseudahrensia aquimaris]|uniref:ABC-F family ATP-binding cassette domain-containing protein n=1 Tax=Pseudahrensia aquimaris TaxID=744461 RepID=A0ABW3FGR2_9HYPH
MAPPLLALRDTKLTFGSTPLLTGADLAVHAGERLCLVGRNGSGKSTLLKIAAGLVEADGGERFVQPGTTIRYLVQEPDLTPYDSIEAYVLDGLEEGDDLHRAARMMEALGLDGASVTTNLSGGEARRAALARALAPDPDVLLLDEPTNHLDLPAIEWLEQTLKACRSALVMISHDRRFLENLSRQTLWVDRGVTRLLAKSFASFEDWRDTLLEQEELDAHKLDRKIVREEHWVTHGVSGRRKRNMKRLGDLGALRQQRAERLKPQGSVSMTVVEAETSGKLVARVEGVSKSFEDRTLVRDFSTRIARGERLGIVGPNGVGKTTLVKLLIGELQPDEGKVIHGANLNMLVVDQKRTTLSPDMTVREALTGGGSDVVSVGDGTKHVQAYMKDFLFLPEQAGTPVHVLSGGERGRLVLAMQLRLPSNFLVLDEPTNDLDLETLDLLQEMISDYQGTVIVVSHDRDFLDRICTSVVVPEGEGQWQEYSGGYSDMLSQRGENPFAHKKTGGEKRGKEAVRAKPKTASSLKLTFKEQHALDTLPHEMEKLEGDIAKLNKALGEPNLFESNPARFNKLVDTLAERQAKLTESEETWLALEMKREELES